MDIDVLMISCSWQPINQLLKYHVDLCCMWINISYSLDRIFLYFLVFEDEQHYTVSYHLLWASLMSLTEVKQICVSLVQSRWFRWLKVGDACEVKSVSSLPHGCLRRWSTPHAWCCSEHLFYAAGRKNMIKRELHPLLLKDTVNRACTQEAFIKSPKAHIARSLYGL